MFEASPRVVVFVICFTLAGIHAREWISPAASTYIVDQLLNSEDPKVVVLARAFEWHIFPVVNPDGYEYSHTTVRTVAGRLEVQSKFYAVLF